MGIECEARATPMNLMGKRVLLGVTGSIAAYKAADLCSQLVKLDADIHVVLTPHAAQFVGAPTFRALSRNPVLTDLFDEPETGRIAHIDMAQSADLVVVVPASANLIAKLANGLADDMLSTCLLATPVTTPILIAPAMNTVMWDHPATVANVETLRRRGVRIIEPGYGLLACQDIGAGKLADVVDIVHAVTDSLNTTNEFVGTEFLITAGATRERLDPVRFLTNRSSGRMGYAIAEEALRRGARVTLVSGHASIASPCGARLIPVESAAEMLAACEAHLAAFSVFIGAAAVADYTPETVAAQKIKKTAAEGANGTEGLTLRLKRTQDILATVGTQKRTGQIVIGFAAETENQIENARRKLESKHADLIVANDVTQEGAGFDVDTNIVTFVSREGELSLPLLSKREVAARLLDEILRLRERSRSYTDPGRRP
jgi:phosphopantothenoylcysteine decarboxylase/phosphopantothenate--cysteine ligase